MLLAPPAHPTPRPERRSPLVIALTLVSAVLSVVAASTAAQAAVVYGTRADISWAPAPGDVSHYGVWLSKPGDPQGSTPHFTTTRTQARIAAEPGDSVVVRVAAFYNSGELGPFSPASDPIQFLLRETRPYDFDGDGNTDAVLRSARDNENWAMLLGAEGVLRDGLLPKAEDARWRISGSTDFDGDGKADLLMWHMDSGAAEIWLMDGLSRKAQLPIAEMGKGWYARALGSREADGAARLLWTNTDTGHVELWLLRNSQVAAQFPLFPMDAGFEIWETCDVDGNGVEDVVWVDDDSLSARAWLMAEADVIDELTLEHPGMGFHLQACGDFERDGRETLVWQKKNELRLWAFDAAQADVATGSSRSVKLPKTHQVRLAVDQDGDGDADLAVINGVRGFFKLMAMEGDAFVREAQVDIERAPEWDVVSW